MRGEVAVILIYRCEDGDEGDHRQLRHEEREVVLPTPVFASAAEAVSVDQK